MGILKEGRKQAFYSDLLIPLEMRVEAESETGPQQVVCEVWR